jgi:hypothetical protein
MDPLDAPAICQTYSRKDVARPVKSQAHRRYNHLILGGAALSSAAIELNLQRGL